MDRVRDQVSVDRVRDRQSPTDPAPVALVRDRAAPEIDLAPGLVTDRVSVDRVIDRGPAIAPVLAQVPGIDLVLVIGPASEIGLAVVLSTARFVSIGDELIRVTSVPA